MKLKKNLLRIINLTLASLLAILGFSNCETMEEYGVPNADYTLKGTIVDKVKAKPIKGVRIGYSPYPKVGVMYGVMPTTYRNFSADTTDVYGEYKLTDHFSIEVIPEGEIPVYVEDIDGEENGLYRDTIINVNFDNAVRSGKQKNWYNGEYTLDLKIELNQKEGNE